jgi:hypothetical protein
MVPSTTIFGGVEGRSTVISFSHDTRRPASRMVIKTSQVLSVNFMCCVSENGGGTVKLIEYFFGVNVSKKIMF